MFNRDRYGQHATVDIIWGIEGLEEVKDGLFTYSGQPIYNYFSYDPSSVEAQQELLDFCYELKKTNKQVSCWIDEFKQYQMRNWVNY